MAQAQGRGKRLPQRVYWMRRIAVLGTALLLVFAVGRLLTGSSDGADTAKDQPGAVQVAGRNTDQTPGPAGPSSAATGPAVKVPKGTKTPKKSREPKPTPTPIAQPDGACDPADVVVAPEARTPIGGGEIVIALMFRTLVSPACYF